MHEEPKGSQNYDEIICLNGLKKKGTSVKRANSKAKKRDKSQVKNADLAYDGS